MHWKKRLLILCIGVPILTWGESQTGSVSGDKPDAVVHFSNKVDGSYEIHAAPVSPWVFTDNFEWSGPNGWYSKGEGTYEIACEKLDFLTYTAFVDASLCFGARMNGQMYIPSNESGNTIPWSVSSAYQPSPQSYIDPAEALIAVGETKSFRYGYDNIFYTNPGGLWKYSGTDVDGNSVQIDWQNAGANYSLPTTLKAGQYMVTAARNTQGAFSAYASAKIIQVKSVSAGTIISATDSPTDNETLYVSKGNATSSITITATPEPGSAWPTGYPTWKVNGTAAGTAGSATYSLNTGTAGSYTVSATCGTSTKAIKIVVLEIISQTIATSPADRTRKTIGIGEVVTLSTNPSISVTWSVSGGGAVSPSSGKSATFTASKSSSTSTIHATLGTFDCTLIFNVIAPTGFNTSIQSSPGLGTLGNNQIGQHTIYNVEVTPTTVSFYNVEFREFFTNTSWTWPSGLVTNLGLSPIPWDVGYNNLTYDNIIDGPYPKSRIYDGTNYINFSYTFTWKEQYKNEAGTWIDFVTGETTITEFEGSSLECRTTNRSVQGIWQGPWQ